jgi:hypothetical protein
VGCPGRFIGTCLPKLATASIGIVDGISGVQIGPGYCVGSDSFLGKQLSQPGCKILDCPPGCRISQQGGIRSMESRNGSLRPKQGKMNIVDMEVQEVEILSALPYFVGRTSATSRRSPTPSPPSTRPSDARGRRSSAFVRERHKPMSESVMRRRTQSLGDLRRRAALGVEASIGRRLTLALRFCRCHPPHEIVGKARERTFKRLAAFASGFAFGR